VPGTVHQAYRIDKMPENPASIFLQAPLLSPAFFLGGFHILFMPFGSTFLFIKSLVPVNMLSLHHQ
jgi:hypothetical protein